MDIRSGQVRSGQVRSGQVRSGQVRSGQSGHSLFNRKYCTAQHSGIGMQVHQSG
jgi:hypothetical protein